MQAIYTGLLAGFIIGVVCVVYVLSRSWYINSRLEINNMDSAELQIESTNWMIMAVFSSGSVFWGFIGAGIYHLLKDYILFGIFSVLFSIFAVIFFAFRNTDNKLDKIILSVIIIDGLGFLIPYLY
ncbi:MAG: hypothetical protein H6696_07190 [Deferribacteres bacterium]|nr:hypothetical protein [candidate division KSB1 bacterium]MCB9501707.1 hypothetical protein [Deferribacteres bacterium]